MGEKIVLRTKRQQRIDEQKAKIAERYTAYRSAADKAQESGDGKTSDNLIYVTIGREFKVTPEWVRRICVDKGVATPARKKI